MVFSQKKIYLVIALTITALLGIVVVQFFWIDAAFNTQQDQFDQRFLESRNQVEKSIKSDEELHNALLEFINSRPGVNSNNPTISKSGLKRELQTKIDSEFKKEFENVSYEFGLVKHSVSHRSPDSLRKESVLISSAGPEYSRDLLESKYRSCKCLIDGQAHINFYFPNKDYVIAAQIWEMLGLSIVCILLVVGCFAYTIYTIRKQKKLAEMKNDFINNMTHEFKTPIFSISLASKTLAKSQEIRESGKLKKYLNLITDESKRLKTQVDKVLQTALIDSDGTQLNKANVDLHELIEQVADNFNLVLSKKNGAFDLNLDADKHIIYGDETHISNILHNLIDNAIKYSDKEPHITISTSDREGGVCFSITDNGIGMDTETKQHIFDRFYRAQTGDIHEEKGFGLGLSYVKNIVEAHSGSIELKSKLNKGSTFTIILPA